MLGDFCAVTGCEQTGKGPFGSGSPNDTTWLQTLCAAKSLSVMGSCFRHLSNHHGTCTSHNGHARKATDLVLVRNHFIVKSHWILSSTEAPANSEHRLAVGQLSLASSNSLQAKHPTAVKCLVFYRSCWSCDIHAGCRDHILNLSTLLKDMEIARSGISNAISHAAAETISFRHWHKKP